MRGKSFAIADLAAAGVKRISLSTTLYRAAMSAVLAAGREVSDAGTFGYVDSLVSGDQLGRYLEQLVVP
jgi:2-methylisocitrate lyase-like PEP mutase family enzyme